MSTRSFQPGDPYGVSFTVKSSTGALVNADSTPAGSAYHNGSADGTVTVTISNSATGVYSASCTIPSGYAVGDRVSFLVTATIGGVATGEFVDHIRLVGYPNNALPNAAAAASGGVPTIGTGSGQINLTSGGVDVQTWLTHAVTVDANNLPIVDVGDWLGHAVTVDSNNAPNVSVKYFGSTAVTGRDIGSSVLLSSGTGTGQLNVTSGVVQANTVQFNGHNVVTDSNNYPGVNIMDVAGQAAAYYTGQAQGPGTGSNQVQLAAAEASNPLFRQISLVGGTGAGQVAICTAYNSSTKTATINCPQGTGGNWAINPDSSTLYAIDGLSAVLDSNGNAHVLGLIKQNQQLNHYPFYLALSSDHMSPATGKTVTATRNIYDGNGFAACANIPTEDGNGWYNITLTAGDLNAPTVALRLTAPGCDPVNINLVTTP